MPPIQLLIKPASGSCNLRCRYCFYEDEMSLRSTANYGIMSRETLEAVVEKSLAYADRSCGFTFQGGEPTLAGLDFFRELMRLEEKHNRKGVQISNAIQTNGFGLDEAWAAFFAESHFLVGVSLDGNKYTHDACRVGPDGGGTFEVVMKTIALFERFSVEYNILTVVNRATAERADKIYAFYAKNHFQYQQYIACLDPMGEPAGGRDYSLTPERYGDFLIRLFDLWYLDLQKGRQPYIRQFENCVALLLGYEPESCEQRALQPPVRGGGRRLCLSLRFLCAGPLPDGEFPGEYGGGAGAKRQGVGLCAGFPGAGQGVPGLPLLSSLPGRLPQEPGNWAGRGVGEELFLSGLQAVF